MIETYLKRQEEIYKIAYGEDAPCIGCGIYIKRKGNEKNCFCSKTCKDKVTKEVKKYIFSE